MKRLTTFVCLLGAMLKLYAQGYIVPNGVVYLGQSFAGYEIDVLQNPTNFDYTGFFLKPQARTLRAVYTNTFSTRV